MDKANLLVKDGLKTLKGFGLDAHVLTPPTFDKDRADAVLEIGRGKNKAKYQVEIKRQVTRATLGLLIERLTKLGDKALLVADYITPPIADQLREHGIAFVDAAGNAYLDQAPYLIWVKGEKPLARAVTQEVGRAFQPTGLQVLFTLLCNPEVVNAPYRDLAKMAGAAHGTVGWVMADLRQLGYLTETKGKRGTRRLFNTQRLLELWAENYARTLRPRTLTQRYYVPTFEGWQQWEIGKQGGLWGGEPAAALLTKYLKPGELTIYAEKLPGVLAGQKKFMREPLPGHTSIVELRKRFWNFPTEQRLDVVPPLLVYADLLATGNARCIETAKIIHDKYIARRLDKD